MIKVLNIAQGPFLEQKYVFYLPKNTTFYQRINATYKINNEFIHYYEFTDGKCVFSFSYEDDDVSVTFEHFKLLVKMFGHMVK